MKRKVLILLSVAIIIYIVLLVYKSNKVKNQFDNGLQYMRNELGLELVDNNWHLDSTILWGYGNYSLLELELLSVPKWKLYLENEKLYCQYWKLNKELSKRVFYYKSIWLWKNKID